MANDPIKPIKRLKYFTGQFLEASDFTAEQDYHTGLRRRGNRALYYRAGILDGGFQVSVNPNDPGRILISPGIGIDGKGRELILVEPEPLEWPLPVSPGWKFVTLRYDEQEADQQVSDQDVSDNTRYEEKPEVDFRADLGDFDNQVEIVIGRIEVDGQGHAVGAVDHSVRQIANARLPGDLTIGQGGNAGLRTRHIDGKDGRSDAADDLFLNWNNGRNVVLGFGEGTRSSLHVSGNVGIGTTSPGSALEIRGPNSPVGADGQRDVSLSFDAAGSARIRAFRGASWDTSLQFLTNSGARGSDDPQVRLHIGEDGKVGIGTAEPREMLEVAGNLVVRSPDSNFYGIHLARTDEENRQHSWALLHMNQQHQKNALALWEYKTDSNGVACGGNPLDGAICDPQLVIAEGGRVGIGTTTPGSYRLMVAGGDTRIAAAGQEQSLFGLDRLVGFNDLRFYVDDTGTTEVMTLDAAGLTVNGKISGKGSFVVGMIIMWSGSIAQIPAGWALCDGTNGTPNLSGRFVVGYSSTDADYNQLGKIGGNRSKTLAITELPSHGHPGRTDTRALSFSFPTIRVAGLDIEVPCVTAHVNSGTVSRDLTHDHSFTTNPVGGGQAFDIRPPYYVLAYLVYIG